MHGYKIRTLFSPVSFDSIVRTRILVVVNVYWRCQWRIKDFPDGGMLVLTRGGNLLLTRFLPKNCIKMKEIDPWGTSLAL